MPVRPDCWRLRFIRLLTLFPALISLACLDSEAGVQVTVRLDFPSAEFPAAGGLPLVVVAEDPNVVWSQVKIGAEFPDIDS
ncbi:MAG TPA: hypothetical protein VJ417_14075, partial [Candidatus Glassbacteria bacterium]|nr:hypothetical protein [Candidatus Glassbacteria bacterium]